MNTEHVVRVFDHGAADTDAGCRRSSHDFLSTPRGLVMINTLLPVRRVAVALAAAAMIPAGVSAQDMPDAQGLIDQYVEAIGGRAAATAAVASRATGTFSIPGMGVTGEVLVVRGPDGAMTTQITIPGMGEMLSGFTDDVGWSMDPMTGPRLLDGAELDAMREQADRLYEVRDASLFESFETVGERDYDGDACWEVKYTTNSGRALSECFSKESGLIIASITTQESPMGEVEVVSLIGSYERFGDILVPTSVTQNMMGQEQVVTISSVEFGDVDVGLLEPPAAIKTLMGAGG